MLAGNSNLTDLTGYYSALFNAKRNQTLLKVSYGIATDFNIGTNGTLKAVKGAIRNAKISNSYHKGTVESE